MSVLVVVVTLVVGLVFVCRLGMFVLTTYLLARLLEAAGKFYRNPAGGGFLFAGFHFWPGGRRSDRIEKVR